MKGAAPASCLECSASRENHTSWRIPSTKVQESRAWLRLGDRRPWLRKLRGSHFGLVWFEWDLLLLGAKEEHRASHVLD